MLFCVVEADGLKLETYQILEVSSRWSRPGLTLPGAVRIDPAFVEAANQTYRYFPRYHCSEDALLLPPPRLARALASLGITPQRPVLVTGTGPYAPINVGRVAWALFTAGFTEVAWLNGGSSAWWGARMPPVQASPTCEGSQLLAPCSVTAMELQDVQLFDVRSRAEYSGQRADRYRFFQSRGHIPGARWLGDWTHLVTPQRRLRERNHLQEQWRRAGVSKDQELVFYCGTGWRSSLACCVALWLGYSRVRNYDGGIYDWISRGLPTQEYRAPS